MTPQEMEDFVERLMHLPQEEQVRFHNIYTDKFCRHCGELSCSGWCTFESTGE